MYRARVAMSPSMQKRIFQGTLTLATVIDHDDVEMSSMVKQGLTHTGEHHVTRRFTLAAAATFAMIMATPALGAELCGMEATPANGGMMVKVGGFEATCMTKSKCSIKLSSVEGMTLELERASVDGSWLALVTAGSQIDSGAGIELVFNGADETRVSPEFLIASEDMKSVRVDDDVSQIVVSTMLESKTVKATVQLVGGKKIVHDVTFADLARAAEWVDCAQGK
jgi:hypothetical protein